MVQLSDLQKSEYFKRSYVGVDGLWFMKVEARYDFDTALSIDAKVWEILPKIQARFLKEQSGLQHGLSALKACFSSKLVIEGFVFESRQEGDGIWEVSVTGCPWLDKLKKADRAGLAPRIGKTICRAECECWAAEFGPRIKFSLCGMLCAGDACCTLRFTEVDG